MFRPWLGLTDQRLTCSEPRQPGDEGAVADGFKGNHHLGGDQPSELPGFFGEQQAHRDQGGNQIELPIAAFEEVFPGTFDQFRGVFRCHTAKIKG